jgi:hypothetical protein
VASLPTGSINLDIAVSQDAKYVYTLNSGAGTNRHLCGAAKWKLKAHWLGFRSQCSGRI